MYWVKRMCMKCTPSTLWGGRRTALRRVFTLKSAWNAMSETRWVKRIEHEMLSILLWSGRRAALGPVFTILYKKFNVQRDKWSVLCLKCTKYQPRGGRRAALRLVFTLKSTWNVLISNVLSMKYSQNWSWDGRRAASRFHFEVKPCFSVLSWQIRQLT